MTALYVLIVIACGIALWSLFESRSANGLHKRVNDAFTRIRDLQDYEASTDEVSNITDDRLTKVENELFREGEYPDLGVRAWCRVWRGRLRNDVSIMREGFSSDIGSLYNRIQYLESPSPEFQKESKRVNKQAEKKATEAQRKNV